MKQAIMFGAGNIGRGFIGQLFSESGYEVTFVDVDDELVQALDREGVYRLQTVFNEQVDEHRIGPVRAVHGSDAEAVAHAVGIAEIGATAVGAGALKHIAPAIAAGVQMRAARGAAPLNLVVCENLKGAAEYLRGLVQERLDPAVLDYFANHIGFVDTVIGRMVPIPTPEMRAEDVSLVRVEPFKELPVDRDAFVGAIPDIVAMQPESGFPLFTARKLYIHNCGHAILAYAGYLRGHVYGYEALADPVVHALVSGGLSESKSGIVAKFGADPAWLADHITDLMRRFANRALGDTIFRLGRDPVRKLNPTDRLVGAATLALESGQIPGNLAWAIAAALLFDPDEDASAQELQRRVREHGVRTVLGDVTGIDPETPFGKAVIERYAVLRQDPMYDIRK